MSFSTDVPDGATQRHSRMMELLTFINLCEPRGVTITQIQSHMLVTFGLKFRTTSEMVKELTISGSVQVDGHGYYHLTGKQKAALKHEETLLSAKIRNLKDPVKKAAATELRKKLLELLKEEP